MALPFRQKAMVKTADYAIKFLSVSITWSPPNIHNSLQGLYSIQCTVTSGQVCYGAAHRKLPAAGSCSASLSADKFGELEFGEFVELEFGEFVELEFGEFVELHAFLYLFNRSSSCVNNWRTLFKSLALLHGGHQSWTSATKTMDDSNFLNRPALG